LKTFEEENQKLQETSKSLQETTSKLEFENGQLKTSVEGLQKVKQELEVETNGLKRIKEQLETKASAHVQSLEGLNNALSQVEQSLQGNQKLSGEHLQILRDEVGRLQEMRTRIQSEQNSVVEGLKKPIEDQLKSLDIVASLVTKLSDWNDSNVVAERIKSQTLLNEQVSTLKAQLATSEERIKQQSAQIDDLKKLKENFTDELGKLCENVSKIDTVGEQLSAVVKKVESAIKTSGYVN
jgi:chromosome segregation ATPase